MGSADRCPLSPGEESVRSELWRLAPDVVTHETEGPEADDAFVRAVSSTKNLLAISGSSYGISLTPLNRENLDGI